MRKLLSSYGLTNKREGVDEIYRGEYVNGYDFEFGEKERLGLVVKRFVGYGTYGAVGYICNDLDDLRTIVEKEEKLDYQYFEFRIYRVGENIDFWYSASSESL